MTSPFDKDSPHIFTSRDSLPDDLSLLEEREQMRNAVNINSIDCSTAFLYTNLLSSPRAFHYSSRNAPHTYIRRYLGWVADCWHNHEQNREISHSRPGIDVRFHARNGPVSAARSRLTRVASLDLPLFRWGRLWWYAHGKSTRCNIGCRP